MMTRWEKACQRRLSSGLTNFEISLAFVYQDVCGPELEPEVSLCTPLLTHFRRGMEQLHIQDICTKMELSLVI